MEWQWDAPYCTQKQGLCPQERETNHSSSSNGTEDGCTGERGSAELTKRSQQRGGEGSEKRKDNPRICAEFDKKWTNLTVFLTLGMLEYFVWIYPTLKYFFYFV